MCCKTLFSPEKLGSVVYICSCGWTGAEPKFTLIPHSWREAMGWESRVFPIGTEWERITWKKTDYVMNVVKGNLENPFGTECPKCGGGLMNDLVLDVGTRNSVVKKHWPDGKPYEKNIKIAIEELRLARDPRNISEYIAEKGASSILWEVLRALEPAVPEKPKLKDFPNKAKFFKAKNEYKAFWRTVFRKEYSINDLLKGKEREFSKSKAWWSDENAKNQTKAILKALGIDLKKSMNSKFRLVSMASELADKRKETAIKVVKALMARTTVSSLLKVIESKNDPEKFSELENFLIGIFDTFGDIYIRNSVIKSMKFKNTYLPGLRMVRYASYKPFEKSTWKHEDFIKKHPKFFENEEFSMDRGKPRQIGETMWIYDPEGECMIPLENISHFVPYNENIGSEDDLDEEGWEYEETDPYTLEEIMDDDDDSADVTE